MTEESHPGDTAADQRAEQIRQLVADCLRRRAAGEEVSDESIIDAHGELMPELAEELRKLRVIAAAQQEVDGRDSTEPGMKPDEQRGLHIRCPHCHNPVELVADMPFTDITCSSCGSHFSLVGDKGSTYTLPTVETIGHFETIEHLGTGSFGTVWKARDIELDRTVALKVPRKGQLTAAEAEQFLREARAAAQLRHPNIVTVHEVGREGENIYIVSAFVHGISLDDWLTGQQLTAREAAELCAKIADGLDHAHQSGVIHRDLKPANVLIDADGQPHIMDFGLAKREAGEITMTLDGQVLGTPAYMSPEQAKGEAHQSDRRTDVYSLGVILFELLTGELPFRGNARMLVHQVVNDEPPGPRKLNSHIPRDLETICLKCMEKDPGRRYATAGELADELRRFLGGEPIQARPLSAPARTWRWCRRKPMVAGLTALVAASLLIGTGVSTYFAVEANKQAIEASDQKERANREAADAKQERDEARQNLYVSDMRLAQKDWEGGQIARLHDLLERHLPSPGQPDLRGWEWYYLFSLCFKGSKTLRGHPRGGKPLAWSPDGTRLASSPWDNTVIIWDPEDGTRVRTLRVPRFAVWLAWSPDGRRLAGKCGERTIIWDAELGREQLTIETGRKEGDLNSWSPDGKRLATPGGDQTVVIWDATTGKEVRKLAGHNTDVLHVAWSPDGKRLAACGDLPNTITTSPNVITIWDTETGEIQGTLEGSAFIVHLAWNPESTRLLSGDLQGALKVWDPIGRRELLLLEHDAPVVSAEWSPDGREIVTGIRGHTITLWDATSGKKLRELRGHTANIRSVVWSPDGQRLASGDREGIVKIWDVQQEQEALTVAEDAVGVDNRIAFSPDDRQLAYCSVDQSIKICDATSGKEIHALPGPAANEFGPPFWSPNGKHLACSGVDASIVIYDTETGKEVQAWTDEAVRHRSEDKYLGLLLAWHPDGRQLASVTSKERTVRVWDALTGKELSSFDAGRPGREDDYHWAVTWSPDGERLATGDSNGATEIWDRAGWRKLHSIQAYDHRVMALAFSPDGRYLATGGDSFEPIVKVWDTFTGRAVLSMKGHTGAIYSAAWSPDGRRIASAGQDGCRIWDTKTGQELFVLPSQASTELAWSHDGNRIATISDGTVKVYDASIGYKMVTSPTYLHDRARVHSAQGDELARSGLYRKAMQHLERALDFVPEDATTQVCMAWLLAACPDPEIRNPERAFDLAKDVVERSPRSVQGWQVLGWASYRLGNWKASIEALETSMELQKGGDPGQWFILAMAHWQLGNKEEARRWYDKAVEWMEKHDSENEQLRHFRAEAVELLELTETTSTEKEKL